MGKIEKDKVLTVVERYKLRLRAAAHYRAPFNRDICFMQLCDEEGLTEKEVQEAKQRINNACVSSYFS